MANSARGDQVVWFDIPCTDLDRAISFYAAVLGCDIEKQTFEGESLGILPHDDDRIGGCLAVMNDTAPSNRGVLIYLNCNGRLDEAVAAVKTNGGTIETDKQPIGPHGFRAVVIDSEGNRVALHSV